MPTGTIEGRVTDAVTGQPPHEAAVSVEGANIRRFIQDGERPPADAVRIEEMINYFPYEWGDVAGEHPFAVTTEVWEAPWEREHRLVRIGLHAQSIDTDDLPPSNLVFLLDVSGSMENPAKMPLIPSTCTTDWPRRFAAISGRSSTSSPRSTGPSTLCARS